ncbi:MAG: c-type cytochrome [Pararhizobium sp.]
MTRIALLACGVLLLSACQREERPLKSPPPAESPDDGITMSSNHPGPGGPVAKHSAKGDEYEHSAYHIAEGERLYTWFNCNGCHFNGGGGMGPALMDGKWIYGSRIENIAQTIREGRPNGMPSFRGLIPDDQIWEIAAYVRAIGGFVRKDIAPSRKDDLSARPSENRLPAPPERQRAPTLPTSGQGKS